VSRTNIDIDDDRVGKAMELYGLRTKREAVELARRRLVGGISKDPHRGMLELRGIGWEGDLDQLHSSKIDADQ